MPRHVFRVDPSYFLPKQFLISVIRFAETQPDLLGISKSDSNIHRLINLNLLRKSYDELLTKLKIFRETEFTVSIVHHASSADEFFEELKKLLKFIPLKEREGTDLTITCLKAYNAYIEAIDIALDNMQDWINTSESPSKQAVSKLITQIKGTWIPGQRKIISIASAITTTPNITTHQGKKRRVNPRRTMAPEPPPSPVLSIFNHGKGNNEIENSTKKADTLAINEI